MEKFVFIRIGTDPYNKKSILGHLLWGADPKVP
jgi:hypothetical protein